MTAEAEADDRCECALKAPGACKGSAPDGTRARVPNASGPLGRVHRWAALTLAASSFAWDPRAGWGRLQTAEPRRARRTGLLPGRSPTLGAIRRSKWGHYALTRACASSWAAAPASGANLPTARRRRRTAWRYSDQGIAD